MAESKPIVHIVSNKLALCGFNLSAPHEWPKGHTWVALSRDTWHDGTCMDCLRTAARVFDQKWVCDFCSTPDPTRDIPCRTFTSKDGPEIPKDARPYMSLGHWMCCEGCWPFIEIGDRDGLIDRAIETIKITDPEAAEAIRDPRVRKALERFHREFWEHKL